MKGVTFLLKMELQKCKGLDLMAEPPCIKVCWVLTAPLQGRGCRAKKKMTWDILQLGHCCDGNLNKWSNWSIEWTAESSLKIQYTCTYYSFKIFLHFPLAKIPRIIHHNQPLLTKLIWKRFVICEKWHQFYSIITARNLESNWEDPGWGWVLLVVGRKWQNISLVLQGRHGQTIG